MNRTKSTSLYGPASPRAWLPIRTIAFTSGPSNRSISALANASLIRFLAKCYPAVPLKLNLPSLLSISTLRLLRHLRQCARFGQTLFEPCAILRVHRRGRQPGNILSQTRHRQRGLDRDRVAFDEKGFEDRHELSVQF